MRPWFLGAHSRLETACPNASEDAGDSTPSQESSPKPPAQPSSKPSARRAKQPTSAASATLESPTSATATTRVADHAYREGRFRRDRWETTFLDAIRADGSLKRAADAAGVDVKTVKRHLKDDPAFAETYAETREEFVDHLEAMLVDMAAGRLKGNFLALIARLKAERPQKYSDKLQVEGAIKNLNAHVFATADEARDLLRTMLADATDITKAKLAGNVIDVPALPAERQP